MHLTSGDVIPFAFEGQGVRTVTVAGDPWFVAQDVCAALSIVHHRDALAKLDADERGAVEVDTLGGRQTAAAVSESGLFTLILRSRDATTPGTVTHRFRKWVTAEVLPTIRRRGTFSAVAVNETPEALALRALTVLQAAVARQQAQLEAIQPKADALDRLTAAEGDMPISAAAKALQIGQSRLFDLLDQQGWIFRRGGGGPYLGYQAKVSAGLLTHRVATIHRPDGSDKAVARVLVTPKGLARLAALLVR